MEEIISRFEIIRLSVRLADHDTIEMQIKKLRESSIDNDLNEILDLLETRNFRQALFLMKSYVDSMDDSFFKEPPKATIRKPKPKEPSKNEYNLFEVDKTDTEKTINLDDMLRMSEESIEETREYKEPEVVPDKYVSQVKERVENSDPLYNLNKPKEEKIQKSPTVEKVEEKLYDIVKEEVDSSVMILDDDIVPDKVEKQELEDDSMSPIAEKVEESRETASSNFDYEVSSVNRDTSVAEDKIVEDKTEDLADSEKFDLKEKVKYVDVELEDNVKYVDITEEDIDNIDKDVVEQVGKIVDTDNEEYENKEESQDTPTVNTRTNPNKSIEKRYLPISYIGQKFRNMRHQFPQVEKLEGSLVPLEVESLLRKISLEGYTEKDIKEAISHAQRYKDAGQKAEASQLLILAAASESKYAQLMLARELFKGDILEIDYPEAFTQINRLAEHDYPEAICDLAQLYEYGYGIKKDKKTAILLYEEAAGMGVERAQKHLDRLTHKKGLLGLLFKK